MSNTLVWLSVLRIFSLPNGETEESVIYYPEPLEQGVCVEAAWKISNESLQPLVDKTDLHGRTLIGYSVSCTEEGPESE